MRVHHLAFRTTELARLERFYVEVLGLTPTRRTEGKSVWLEAEGLVVMLERKGEDEPDVPEGSLELVAFAIAPHEHAVYTEQLLERGVAIEAKTAYSMYFRDPDGRRIALSSYPDQRSA